VSEILKEMLKWTAVFTAGGVATYYRRLSIEQLVFLRQANKMAINLRQHYFETLLKKRISVFSEKNSANLAHQLGSDIWQISHTLIYEFSSAMRGAAFLTGGVGFLIYTSAPLTCVTLMPISALAVLSRYYGGILKKEREKLAQIARFNQMYTQERLAQIKTVKLFTSESQEIKKYQSLLENMYNQSVQVAHYTGKHQGIMEGFGQNSMLWCIGYGAYLITIDSGLTVGKLTAFAMYSMYSGMGFRLLASGYTEMKKISGVYQQIYETASNLNEEAINLSESKSAETVSTKFPYIEFKNVKFKYPARDSAVLQDVSLQIGFGEIVGIVGHSGSGKSSIFHLLTQLYRPDFGNVLIGGVDLQAKPEWWSRQMISIVSQESQLFSGTILDNIRYSKPDATEEEVVEACRNSDALEFIMELPDKLLTQVGEAGNALSGGQRQRIAIARALLKNPSIFLFDEATSALDASSESYFQNIIKSQFKGKGYTVLIITHRVRSLRDIVDKFVLVDEGRVVACDTFDKIKDINEFKLLL
jgi:ABC-type multidrug transport system fused ATPase/permease subunit